MVRKKRQIFNCVLSKSAPLAHTLAVALLTRTHLSLCCEMDCGLVSGGIDLAAPCLSETELRERRVGRQSWRRAPEKGFHQQLHRLPSGGTARRPAQSDCKLAPRKLACSLQHDLAMVAGTCIYMPLA